MRILFSGYPSPFLGGGAISALTLLKKLAQKHEVIACGMTAHPSRKEELSCRIKLYEQKLPCLLRRRFLPSYLKILLIEIIAEKITCRLIEEIQPDLIIMQEPAIRILTRRKAKILVFVRHYNYWLAGFYPSWWSRIYNEPFNRVRGRRNLKILREADLVLANSKFTAQALNQVGIEAKVVYPFIDLSSYKVREGSREFILFIHPTYLKGADIVFQIAKRLPDQKFMIVGSVNQGLKRRIEHYNNVELLGWCDDMKEVYEKAKIILVPSVSEEPFGRVPVEAGISGIPSIASNRGGLPEAVGEGGILIKDIWNIEEWVRAIERLDDPKVYKELSQKAIENAEKFDFEKTFREFKEIVNVSLCLPELL